MNAQSDQSTFDYEFDSEEPGKGLWIILGVIVVIIGCFVFLRTEPSDIQNGDQLALILNDGQPKVIEFYSNF